MVETKSEVTSALKALRERGALAARLEAHNKTRFLKRIYVMGCGRSGTWLLTGIMATFKDASVLYKEIPVEYFGLLSSDHSAVVLKRTAKAYETIEAIPPQIIILFIVRHPFDVLTSHHAIFSLISGRQYHVTPGRWLGETLALRWLIDSQRPCTKIVRYEDLVTDPNRIQAEIGSFLEMEIETPADEYHKVFKPPPEIMRTMQGLRPPDVSSIGRWKSDPEAIAYLKSIQLRLSACLPWIEKTFGYHISLS
jgi:hypothetical protein